MAHSMKRALLLLTLLSFLAPCPGNAATVGYTEQLENGSVDWRGNLVLSSAAVSWEGDQPPGRDSDRLAVRRALIQARGRLFKALQGIVVDRDTVTASLLDGDQSSLGQVRGMVHNAPIQNILRREDKSVEVTVGIHLYEGLARAVVPEIAWIETGSGLGRDTDRATAAETWTRSRLAPDGYTGLIVDARGYEAHPALLPRVLDQEGREIYGPGLAEKSVALKQGMVQYLSGLDEAGLLERVGKRPLHLRAMGVSGKYKCDLVIGRFSARDILDVSKTRQALSQCRVIILMDGP